MVSVQVRVLPDPPHVAELPQVELCDVGAGETLGVIELNVTGVAPEGIAVAVMVNVCDSLIPLVSFGVIEIDPSTNRFVAGPLPPGPLVPDVDRVTDAVLGVPPVLLKLTVAEAFAVNVAAVGLFTVSVQVNVPPLAAMPVVHVVDDVCGATTDGASVALM